jgi:ethanolamine utilization protein EutA (predicted chaperonin)
VGTTNVGGIFITGTSATQGNIRPAVGVGSVLISDDSGLSANGLTIPDGGGAIISSESATYDMLTLQIGGTTKHSFNKDGNVGIGATNPNTARLHIKGDTNNPVIRVETALIESPAGGTAGRTLKGWLPIMTGANVGDKVYIPLFGPYI